jgi:hypothetical protein
MFITLAFVALMTAAAAIVYWVRQRSAYASIEGTGAP